MLSITKALMNKYIIILIGTYIYIERVEEITSAHDGQSSVESVYYYYLAVSFCCVQKLSGTQVSGKVK